MERGELALLVRRVREALPRGEEEADKALDELHDIVLSLTDSVSEARRDGFRQAATAAAGVCRRESDVWWKLQSDRSSPLLPGFCRMMGDAWTMCAKEIASLRMEDDTSPKKALTKGR